MNKTIPLLLLIASFILGFYIFRKYICPLGATSTVAAATPPVVAKTLDLGDWIIRDADAFNTSSDQHFRFIRSRFGYLEPLSTGLNNALEQTAGYLNENPNRSLKITGYYDDGERNLSVLPNVGQARANRIKRLFMSMGVPASQILIDGDFHRDWFLSDTLFKGIDFSFADIPAGDDRLAEIKSRLVGKPIVLHFETDESTINLTSQQRQDFLDLIYYLDHVDDAGLDIVGHTDNEGDRDYNLQLSRERADFIKNYLNINGSFALDKMAVSGRGPDQPVATNDTPEGKAQNRRVEVTLK